jgi:hypothetical protein
MNITEKVRENRLRRMAQRQLLRLEKSRRRDPKAPDFNGYMLIDDRNVVVLGAYDFAYSATLDQVEAYLTDESRPRWRKSPGDSDHRWHIPGKG